MTPPDARAGGESQASAEPITGFMCKIDFDVERFEPRGGNSIFASLEDLRRAHPCAETCGIVEVEVKLRRVVVETSDEC